MGGFFYAFTEAKSHLRSQVRERRCDGTLGEVRKRRDVSQTERRWKCVTILSNRLQ